jgi:CHAT domain-containing protein
MSTILDISLVFTMKLFGAILLLLAFLTLSLNGSHSYPPKTSQQFESTVTKLRALMLSGHFAEAIPEYRRAADAAKAANLPNYEVKFLNNLGVCQFALFQFQPALSTMSETRKLAKQIGERQTTAVLDANISSLFSQLGNDAEAAQSAREGILYADSVEPARRSLLFGQLGKIQSRMGNMDDAERSFRQAIEIAGQADNSRSAAWAWDSLAYARWKSGRLSSAADAASQGLAVRKQFHVGGVESSYMLLGGIRADQGDLPAALELMDEAVKALQQPGPLTPPWIIYKERGRVKMLSGDLESALDDLRSGLASARKWRVDVVANDANRSGSEGALAELYQTLIQTGNRLYLKNHDPALIRETFDAAEENRAASLRALIPQQNDWRRKLPSRYYELLAKLQATEAAAMQSGGSQPPAELLQLRSELGAMEARVGAPAADDHFQALAHAQRMLDRESVLFSFQLGTAESWLWAVTNDGISLYRLPPSGDLETAILAFRQAVESNDAKVEELGGALYRRLFGSVPRQLLARERWLLVLDGRLFNLPFPALAPAPRKFLVEEHSLRISPGVLLLKSAPQFPGPRREFLAVGDPIYNFADPRAPKSRPAVWPASLIRVNYDRSPAFARLWGTAREIEVSAKAWSAPESVLLTGQQASPENFWERTKAKPDIIHIATHILEGNDNSTTGLIAFSLGPSGRVQYITPEDILARSISAQLVVLSGCSSGRAEIRPATGLMGLTRAWVAAGAGAVLATRWPTVDDDGAFFESFYRNFRLQDNGDTAEALRQATLDMLRSGGWRAKPSFWAGYFLVGNY